MRKKGFTLVELLVAVGLFALLSTMSAGAYLVIISISDRAHTIALTSDNLAFVLENMARSISTGSNFSCGAGGDCATGNNTFSFTDTEGVNNTYTFVTSGGYINQTYAGAVYRVTDPSITITSLQFNLVGSGLASADYAQPFVRIVMSGSADLGKGETYLFTVQTASTMRGIDI